MTIRSANFFTVFFTFAMLGECVPMREVDMELVLLSVVFRHGARTTYRFYPNDPNKNSTFYPFGLGCLTNEGKLQAYNLGKYLRRIYGDFLGDIYTEELVEMRSTYLSRTRMSAQLVSAGMWPPADEQKWHPTFPWQPIPVYYKEKDEEDLLSPTNCPYRSHVLAHLSEIQEVRERFLNPYKDLFETIENYSGFVVKNPIDVLEFYFIISTEAEMGLSLPSWVEGIYPEPLTSTAALVYDYWNYNARVKSVYTGNLLKKMITDSVAKKNETLSPKGRKVFMYSGHDSTLGCLLNALDVVEPHIPPYGSAVILELRKDDHNNHFFVLKYHTDLNTSPTILKLPGCSEICPMDAFIKLTNEFVPKKDKMELCSLNEL